MTIKITIITTTKMVSSNVNPFDFLSFMIIFPAKEAKRLIIKMKLTVH